MQIQQNYDNKYSTKLKVNEFVMTQVFCDLIKFKTSTENWDSKRHLLELSWLI